MLRPSTGPGVETALRVRVCRRRWRAAIGVGALTAVVLALILSRPSNTDRDRATGTDAPTTFSIEAAGGELVFGGQGGEGSLSYDGDQGQGRLSFDLDGDGVVTEADGGRFEVTTGEPPGWPPDLPDPPEAVALEGAVIEAGALVQLSTTYRTPRSGADVLDFYRRTLTGADPVVDPLPGGTGWLLSFEGRWTGFLTVEVGGDATVVGVQVVQEGAAAG